MHRTNNGWLYCLDKNYSEAESNYLNGKLPGKTSYWTGIGSEKKFLSKKVKSPNELMWTETKLDAVVGTQNGGSRERLSWCHLWNIFGITNSESATRQHKPHRKVKNSTERHEPHL